MKESNKEGKDRLEMKGAYVEQKRLHKKGYGRDKTEEKPSRLGKNKIVQKIKR